MNELRGSRCDWVSCLAILYCAVTAGCSGSDPISGVGCVSATGTVSYPIDSMDLAGNAAGSLVIEGGELTLDAQARNVFW